MNKDDLTPEQKELLTDLVEFYNSHAVETVRFGHTRRFGELGIWSWSFVTFTLKTDRTVLFRFKRTLITSAFEECFCYLIHQKTTKLFPDEGGVQNTFAWENGNMIDERDFFLHFNEFKKYVKDAEPITILKDIEFQKFFKAFVDRQTKRHIDKFKDFIEYLLNNGYRGWVYVMVENHIAHKISFRSGMLSDSDLFFIDVCQNNEYEVVNTYELCSYPSQQVYEIRWKQEDGADYE